jgi:hypothetical protein
LHLADLRPDTFPGEVFLHLAADALEWCRASQAEQPLPPGGTARAVPARVRVPRTAKREASVRSLGRSGRPWGIEPDLVDEVAAWQTDDFWQYAMYAAVAYIRAAASRAGVPVRQACRDLDKSPGD